MEDLLNTEDDHVHVQEVEVQEEIEKEAEIAVIDQDLVLQSTEEKDLAGQDHAQILETEGGIGEEIPKVQERNQEDQNLDHLLVHLNVLEKIEKVQHAKVEAKIKTGRKKEVHLQATTRRKRNPTIDHEAPHLQIRKRSPTKTKRRNTNHFPTRQTTKKSSQVLHPMLPSRMKTAIKCFCLLVDT